MIAVAAVLAVLAAGAAIQLCTHALAWVVAPAASACPSAVTEPA